MAFKIGAIAAFVIVIGSIAYAQTIGLSTAIVVSACGTPPATYSAGTVQSVTMDATGKLCLN